MDTELPKNNNCLAIWAITPNGKTLGKKIQAGLKDYGPGVDQNFSCDAVLFISEKLDCKSSEKQNSIVFKNLGQAIKDKFNLFQGHVFIFSTGIAVRLMAPLLNSKITDPAVVVMDDKAIHAISLLSGHLGGANELACIMGSITGAKPVITTATDTNLLPSIDMIAKKAGLYIETPDCIKQINMAFLTGEKICLHDPLNLVKPYLPVSFWDENKVRGLNREHLFCSYRVRPVSRETFILRPRVLCVGIGCNRGTTKEEIEEFLNMVFKKQGLSTNSIKKIASTEVKRDEKGLLALSEKMQVGLDFYSKEQLNSVTNIQTPSEIVEKHLGVKSVCEAAAILSAEKLSSGRGELILPKQKNKDVTIAVAINQ